MIIKIKNKGKKMNKVIRFLKKHWLKSIRCFSFLVVSMIASSILVVGTAFAADINAVVTISSVADTIGKSVLSLGAIISDIALVAGIGFLLASFFKFDQHKKNPTQIPVSQPLTLMLIGAALCLFPTIMPLVQTAAFGSKAERGAVGTGTVKTLIGSS